LVSLTVSGGGGYPAFYLEASSGAPTFTTALVVSTSQYTKAGTYTFTISGSGGGITRSAQATVQVSVPVSSEPDFQGHLTADRPTANVGDPVKFTISVTNVGSGIATNVQVVLSIPSSLFPGFQEPTWTYKAPQWNEIEYTGPAEREVPK